MSAKPLQNRAWLLASARTIAEPLKLQSEGTRLRIRIPSRTTTTNTHGWSASIGDLGKAQPRREVWFDKFSGYSVCKLFACFCTERRRQLTSVTSRVARKLWPSRVVTMDDTEETKFLVLTKRLARSEFNTPVLEKYQGGRTVYGIYDPTRETAARVSPHFCTRALAFFEDAYGKLGREFAEAHHMIPLSQLRGQVRSRMEHLTTVCANCHRMLHRMDGKREDVRKLRLIVRRHNA